ncbi:RAMP superfamily CRISPR-associated protein [Dolichospermum circinale]|uniref:RAMP superfamily CRISPR-associated protein n=1 Tax=Dolichospermum circinale TaxID=109265 RepID=UPI000416F11B|nr:RAMP superfamily CRISPR-associated protein [Dolichospermum circinale]MDB9454598.1 RAMP superfamily protein [Dolichospermum circinale CS-541/06]MDB9462280.1 RAMP superfamily protein [Dolichospermum circinale CS-541/04]MDB9547379.1 RAMP superfamily protein [Dolichospermum circinale CS-1031]
MYTGIELINLLEKQHQKRSQSGLFKKDTFIIQWRAKVGSFPHPDVETIVSAGEPCGAWRPNQGRPEDKRNVSQNWETLKNLPLHGYIPGSCIRGLVRAWAKQRPEIKPRMYQLLGHQDNDKITAGKIEFLDAWPETATKLSLDIVNPQQEFQVYHQGQCTPLSLYTLGNGKDRIAVIVAMRGIPGKATEEEVSEVWEWVQQALGLYGVGSRTASGYGGLKTSSSSQTPTLDPGYAVKQFEFSLYSQGSAGPHTQTMELRPSHWRGWLRSWLMRFFLGVMPENLAKLTVAELMGEIDAGDGKSRKGCVRLQMIQGKTWGERSENQPFFYLWKGKLQISAPKDILNKIILPIIRFAVMVGGVGRGWRRPLHIFNMNTGRAASRGTQLILTHKLKDQNSGELKSENFGLPLDTTTWTKTYSDWVTEARNHWQDRVSTNNRNIKAEVFSPTTCAIYVVPGPDVNPIETSSIKWNQRDDAEATRGDGMYLIYHQNHPRNYKRNPDLGGNAAGGGNGHCSWASIKRVNIPNQKEKTDCQEIVCLFMGGQTPNATHVRSRFLRDLKNINGNVHLFGVQPPAEI